MSSGGGGKNSGVGTTGSGMRGDRTRPPAGAPPPGTRMPDLGISAQEMGMVNNPTPGTMPLRSTIGRGLNPTDWRQGGPMRDNVYNPGYLERQFGSDVPDTAQYATAHGVRTMPTDPSKFGDYYPVLEPTGEAIKPPPPPLPTPPRQPIMAPPPAPVTMMHDVTMNGSAPQGTEAYMNWQRYQRSTPGYAERYRQGESPFGAPLRPGDYGYIQGDW